MSECHRIRKTRLCEKKANCTVALKEDLETMDNLSSSMALHTYV